ncbi:MAG: hypothetical protein PHD76_06510 [Methylacidiphilales bacterium]|nr:hypothetical protein [Candidatus Methylacidiphilales bacterium]
MKKIAMQAGKQTGGRPFIFGLVLLGGYLVSFSVCAGEVVIPEAYPIERYEPVWKKSPFTLSSVPDAGPTGGLSDKFKLTGVLKIGDEPYVSIYDTENKERFLISRQVNAQGVKLDALQTSDDLSKVVANLSKSGETFSLHYDMDYLKQVTGQSPMNVPGQPIFNNQGHPPQVQIPSPVNVQPQSTPPPPPQRFIRRPFTVPSQSSGS